MQKHKISFVVLHYLTIEDTIKCVESILDILDDASVVIVDNASKNNTGIELKNNYESNPRVHVILNDTNLGFARGNNVGFKYAKDVLKSDFIILCNNDTYITDKKFENKIIEEYNNSKFALLGPKIILKDNTVNKISLNLPTIKKVKSLIHYFRIEYIIYKYLIFLIPFYKVYHYLKDKRYYSKDKKFQKKNPDNLAKYNRLERHENILLHGCFWIFSSEYISRFDGLNDRTFLYKEEELLLLRIKAYNLKSVYNPDVYIYHNEDSATKAEHTDKRKKLIFFCKNQVDSLKVLLDELIKVKNEGTINIE